MLTVTLLALVLSVPAYVYGVAVGLRTGKRIGRKQSDAEWAVIMP